MKVIRYGYIGEDEAHRVFVRNYLSLQASNNLRFELDEEFIKQYQATNRYQVKAISADAAQVSLIEFEHDLFVIVADVDSSEPSEFIDLKNYFDENLLDSLKPRITLMLPVQCIEHWLWYLKYYQGGTVPEGLLENHKAKLAKQQVYNLRISQKRTTNEYALPIVEKLTQIWDFEWLANRSESFRHFHQQVVKFVETYNNTTKP